MKKYIQPEINVMEMEMESQLCETSNTSNTIGISNIPTGESPRALERPRFSIWDSEDDVEE